VQVHRTASHERSPPSEAAKPKGTPLRGSVMKAGNLYLAEVAFERARRIETTA